MVEFSKVVAIDGPSGSGKSTVAKMIAEEMKLLYVDTGAMFRALGLAFFKKGISLEDDGKLIKELSRIKFEYGLSEEKLVVVDGENLTMAIRDHHVSDLASRVSKIPAVRSFLKDIQRGLVQERVCIMEGRDIGTAVFPQAFCKLFLTASLDVRSQRRFKELWENGQRDLSLETVRQDIQERDERDTQRSMDPLRKADDAHFFDTSPYSLTEVVKKICDYIRESASQVGLVL